MFVAGFVSSHFSQHLVVVAVLEGPVQSAPEKRRQYHNFVSDSYTGPARTQELKI